VLAKVKGFTRVVNDQEVETRRYCRTRAEPAPPTSDFFNATMSEIFANQQTVKKFFDDVGVFTDGTFEEHLAEVEKVLTILQDKGFTVKPSKCKWCCKECYYLGYAMQTNGIYVRF